MPRRPRQGFAHASVPPDVLLLDAAEHITAMAGHSRAKNGYARHHVSGLQPDLAQADARAEPRLDRFLRATSRLDLDDIDAGVLRELVELEVAKVVGARLGDRLCVPPTPH